MSVHRRTVTPMSVHKRATGGHEVRWAEGTKQRSKTFKLKKDADRFDAEVKRRKELGEVGLLVAGRETLEEYGGDWLVRHARTLQPSTRLAYAHTWNAHIIPFLGHMRLTAITPSVVRDFEHALATDPEHPAGAPTRRKALAILSACMRDAVLDGKVATNPVLAVRKPPVETDTARVLVNPEQVERMRTILLADHRAHDAILVATLAYAGLRPEEALALRWDDIGEQTINVDRAVVLGTAKPTKTRRARHVDLLPALAADLQAVRVLTNGKARDLIWSYRRGLWADHHYRNWRSRVYQPLAGQVDLPDRRPYSLRHSFASLLIASGRTLVEVAAQLGHGTDVCGRTYARAFAEYRGRTVDVNAEIAGYRTTPLDVFFDGAAVDRTTTIRKLAEEQS